MEEVEIGETPNNNIKEIELIEGNIKYITQIQIDKQYLDISIYNDNIIKYKGKIHIINIQCQLGVLNYTIDDIFDEIYKLNNNKFKLIKDINKYKLQIEFIILNKKRNIDIELYDNIINNNKEKEYINKINELKEIIKEKDNEIKLLKEELNKYKNKDNDIYNNFNIKDKEPKHILNYHTDWIRCSTVLKDGRFVTGSKDKSIIIYNNSVTCVIQLSSGELVSCSEDKTIKIYNINESKYNVIQTLAYHTNWVSKIIELKNKQLVSCSGYKSIIFYNKDNDEYNKDYSITTYGYNGPIIQTKDNEICYYEDKDTICFYDLIKRNNIKKINNIRVINHIFDSLLIISKEQETNSPELNCITQFTLLLCSLIIKSGLNVLLLYIIIELSFEPVTNLPSFNIVEQLIQFV